MIDLNNEAAPWTGLLAAATANAITDFEVEFCESRSSIASISVFAARKASRGFSLVVARRVILVAPL